MRSSRLVVRVVVGTALWVVAVGLVYYAYGQFADIVVERAIGNAEGGANPIVESPAVRPTDWTLDPDDLNFDGVNSFEYSDTPGLGAGR